MVISGPTFGPGKFLTGGIAREPLSLQTGLADLDGEEQEMVKFHRRR